MELEYKTLSVRHHRAGRFFFCLVLTAALASCSKPKPTVLEGEAQGTYYRICYYDSRNLQPQVDSLLQAFDLSASLWVDSSLLRRVNANLTDSLDPVLDSLLRYSLYIYDYTDGAFDCRVGRIVQAWGFSFRERTEPDSSALAALLKAAREPVCIVPADSVGRKISKACPDTELDFNAIAQGYSVDLLARMMDNLGVADYLIDVGGEVIARGSKADGKPWRVGIERPSAGRYDAPTVQSVMALRNASVVTSGSYRKFYERDGVRYSHTISPATGRPVQHSLLSVSVMERECWLADAMATAYMVMGLDSARAFISAHQGLPGTAAVMFIYDSCGSLATYSTPEFKKLIQ
ncbi:MAG: FAD:protein FMN transferase [Bacteroidales bacterium]|nr:FAD:protein FMN transferase [Bacteroidales bacterium]